MRTDKSTANHIRIAFETMISIAENITLDELHYRYFFTNRQSACNHFVLTLFFLLSLL